MRIRMYSQQEKSVTQSDSQGSSIISKELMFGKNKRYFFIAGANGLYDFNPRWGHAERRGDMSGSQ